MGISAPSNSFYFIFPENKVEIKGSITTYEAQSSFASVLKRSPLALARAAPKESHILEAAIQFRNKAIEVYQEMMRTSMSQLE